MHAANKTSSRDTQAPDFATIVRRHQAGVYRYLKVLGAGDHASADLTQETLLLILEKPFIWQSEAQTATWLRRSARFLFLNHCRKTKRNVLHEDLDLLENAWTSMVQDIEGEELLWALRTCMAKLAPRAQEAINMRYAEDARREEIAIELNMSKDGVKSLLQRSRRWLRSCIEGRQNDPHSPEGA